MADYGDYDNYGHLVSSTSGPAPRKRGRPRKESLPADETAAKAEITRPRNPGWLGSIRVDEGELAFDYRNYRPGPAVNAVAGLAGVGGPMDEPAVKRRRGRPRKDPRTEEGVIAGPTGLQALEPCVGTGVTGRAEVAGRDELPVKRGPGRPRKNPLPEVPVPAVTILGPSSWVSGGLMAAESPAMPVKRKAGRPRKTPLAVVGVSPKLPGVLAKGTDCGVDAPEEAAGTGLERAIGSEPGQIDVAGPGMVPGKAPGPVIGPVKRKPGRPRKHPLPEPNAPGLAVLLPVKGVSTPVTEVGGNGTGLVDRYGIGPANEEGIGFWPPRPDEMESVKISAIEAGVVSGRKRGRKKKTEVPADNAPKRPGELDAGPEIGGVGAFCGKCGTYTRLYRPARGPARRVCPKCHPERIPDRKSPLDRTGMPCKDRGKCRPVRCFKAFECEEMKRLK